uniref:Uncharacterized protein n=1 Tax=Anguilla anguilla TaxID=7936 RepID=A0A0E9XT28_ANGAN
MERNCALLKTKEIECSKISKSPKRSCSTPKRSPQRYFACLGKLPILNFSLVSLSLSLSVCAPALPVRAHASNFPLHTL